MLKWEFPESALGSAPEGAQGNWGAGGGAPEGVREIGGAPGSALEHSLEHPRAPRLP